MNEIKLKTKVILSGEEDFFGPGVCRLLLAIDETGSIQGAAKKMEMSYTKCWKLINRAEAQSGIHFVDRLNGGKNGGSTTLTEQGRRFVEQYQALRRELKNTGEELMRKYFPEENGPDPEQQGEEKRQRC